MVIPLAEQQHLLRDALDVLKLREGANENDSDWLRFALSDHDDPEIGCLAETGECIAVQRARKIIAGAA